MGSSISKPAPRPPVLLVPGIGGTILDSTDLKTGDTERAWVQPIDMSDEFKENMWSIYNEKTGVTDPLNPRVKIVVPQTNAGLYAIDNLCPPLKNGVYYGDMIDEMRDWGYVSGETLFGFGYDFRQSNRLDSAMTLYRQKIADIHQKTGQKVNIISHSMGGLITKSLLALHKDDFAAHVNSWTAIAAPFRGAPGLITDTLVAGPAFITRWMEIFLISKWTTHQMLEQCPSVFEMMAQYDNFDWKTIPEVRIVYNDGSKTVIKSTDDFIAFITSALKNNEVKIDGKVIPLPVNLKCVSWALDSKKKWDTAQIPEGVAFYNITGIGKKTPYHVT